MGLGQVCPGRGEAALAVPAWEGGREGGFSETELGEKGSEANTGSVCIQC